MHGGETMMIETDDPRPASKSLSTIYFMWQSKKLTNVVECYKITACIRSQHTTGARCGPDQGTVVENRHTTGLKVVAPGLLEKIQLCGGIFALRAQCTRTARYF